MDYLTLDCWSIPEAAILLAGGTPVNASGVVSAADQRPLRPGEPDILKDIRTMAFNSMDAGTLAYVGKRQHGLVAPSEFCRWAVGKGYDLPKKLRPLLGQARGGGIPSGAETLSPELPDSRPRLRHERMARILEALRELDPSLDIRAMPGRKVDLLELCQAIDRHLFSTALDAFEKTALKGQAQFTPGAQPTTYYRERTAAVRAKLG
jgi:hypothetical protein